MDVISIYSQYVGMSPQKLGRHIEGSDCLRMAEKHAALNADISKLRSDSIVFDASGEATAKPEMGKRIANLEAKRQQLEEIAKEYGEVLESVGVVDPTHPLDGDLHRKRASFESVAKSGPNRCWHSFNIMHGKHPEIMPFDLARDPEYLKIEEAQRVRMADAEKELESLKVAIKRLRELELEVKEF
jgi:hypothetical protein